MVCVLSVNHDPAAIDTSSRAMVDLRHAAGSFIDRRQPLQVASASIELAFPVELGLLLALL